jgi:outer membrane receptor protein involved in Fe transport
MAFQGFINLKKETFVKANTTKISPKTIAVAASLAAMQIGAVYAQNLNLDEVVVTASPTGRTKMKSSDSVTSLGEEAISRSGATNAVEILRTVPGIRAESSSGDSNANITVRGAPISAGGSRYVQIQEDGLPLMLFGDIAFGNADMYLRTDYTTDRLEVVRGGSASTLATNSPGGVINFISKAGRDAGNAIGVTTGVGSKLNRYDFNFGSSIGADTYFNVGGFTRQGEGGAIKTGFNSQDGGQFKASVTKEFDKGSYVRVNFKSLDDKTPALLPVPVRVSNGKISTYSNIDPRNAFFINPNITRDVSINRDGNQVVSNPADGVHVQSRSIGLEAKLDIGGGWTVEERMRKTSNSGRWLGMFPDVVSGGNTFSGSMFNSSLDNLDNMFNDLKASKAFDLNGGTSVFTGGLFTGSQNLARTNWFNTYDVGMTGSGASYSALTQSGWSHWGPPKSLDLKYSTKSPYAALNWEKGPLSIEGSVRHNEMTATGQTIKAVTSAATTSNTGFYWDPTTLDTINYKVSKTSYSLGSNYALNSNNSIYARVSNGYNFAADRLVDAANPGELNGSRAIPVNQLKQQEIGLKSKQGNLSLFGTFFMAQTDETNYEVNNRVQTKNKYDAKGIELEAGYKSGAFRLNAGATYTDAKIKDSLTASDIGKTPRRQAKWVYSLVPSFSTGDFQYGAAFVGTSKSYTQNDNAVEMPAYMVTNLFAKYRISKQAIASLSVNNAFNKVGYTEGEARDIGYVARSIQGRTATASLKYEF